MGGFVSLSIHKSGAEAGRKSGVFTAMAATKTWATAWSSSSRAHAGFRSSLRHLDGRTLNLACDGEVTRPGQVRRVRGGGMPRRRAGGKGDLLLRFAVRFPSDPIASEASRALKQLLPRDAGSTAPVHPGERLHHLETVQVEGEQDADSFGF